MHRPAFRIAFLAALLFLGATLKGEADPPRKPVPVPIAPEPMKIEPGAALSPVALVSQPTTITGVQSWTLETRRHRGDSYVTVLSPDGRLVATGGMDSTVRI